MLLTDDPREAANAVIAAGITKTAEKISLTDAEQEET
jgi:hypothetical protein